MLTFVLYLYFLYYYKLSKGVYWSFEVTSSSMMLRNVEIYELSYLKLLFTSLCFKELLLITLHLPSVDRYLETEAVWWECENWKQRKSITFKKIVLTTFRNFFKITTWQYILTVQTKWVLSSACFVPLVIFSYVGWHIIEKIHCNEVI